MKICFLQISLPEGILPISNFLPMIFSMALILPTSFMFMMAIEIPVFPALPVLPLRWV